MQYYNDFERAIHGYLRNYNQFAAKSKSLAIDIATITEQLSALCDAKIANYGTQPPGGSGEYTPVERNAMRAESLTTAKTELEANKRAIDTIIAQGNNQDGASSFRRQNRRQMA